MSCSPRLCVVSKSSSHTFRDSVPYWNDPTAVAGGGSSSVCLQNLLLLLLCCLGSHFLMHHRGVLNENMTCLGTERLLGTRHLAS